jgi:hypothetical protein
MKVKGYRSGVALLTALVLTGASMIVLGGVLGYVSNASRMTGYYESKNICRLAAQSEIELAKAAINRQFEYSLNRSARIVGGDAMGLSSTSSYDWFEEYSGDTVKKTIGKAVGTKVATLTLADVVTNNGCIVKVRIGRVEHTVGDQWANVTLVAEATRPGRGGITAKTILEETIRFAQRRSQVFNNAYFVNNFGWFEGGSSTFVNGDIRSNGDMKLDNTVIVNGHIYAARNDDLGSSGVDGNIYGASGATRGNMHDLETYKKSSTNYGTSNRARPLETDPTTGVLNKGGYAAPNNADNAAKDARLHPNMEFSVEMPYIGDISSNESEYRAWAQELHDKDSNMSTIKKGGQTLVSVYYDGVGPSGLETVTYNGKEVMAPDYGAIVLEGTASDPIVVNGPVIIPSDVIIKGYVKGQGTIYSGRNIHIVGDIKYVNPPSWQNKSSSGSNNKNKDMLGLMAKGNIVLGDYTIPGWLTGGNGIEDNMKSQTYVPAYDCDTSDAAIGYPKRFNATSGSTKVNYTSVEKVPAADFAECENAGLADFVPGGRDASSGQFGKTRTSYTAGTKTRAAEAGTYDVVEYYYGRGYVTQKYLRKNEEYTPAVKHTNVEYNRKYYETVCEDSIISSMYGNTSIAQIDAVLYNNHAICGHVGTCSFNGALVCRNEAIRYGRGLYLNWDIRLYSGSSETVDNDKVGLAKSSDNPPQVIDWRELPEGVVTFD